VTQLVCVDVDARAKIPASRSHRAGDADLGERGWQAAREIAVTSSVITAMASRGYFRFPRMHARVARITTANCVSSCMIRKMGSAAWRLRAAIIERCWHLVRKAGFTLNRLHQIHSAPGISIMAASKSRRGEYCESFQRVRASVSAAPWSLKSPRQNSGKLRRQQHRARAPHALAAAVDQVYAVEIADAEDLS